MRRRRNNRACSYPRAHSRSQSRCARGTWQKCDITLVIGSPPGLPRAERWARDCDSAAPRLILARRAQLTVNGTLMVGASWAPCGQDMSRAEVFGEAEMRRGAPEPVSFALALKASWCTRLRS